MIAYQCGIGIVLRGKLLDSYELDDRLDRTSA